ncbi:unnamed protein product [Protopolystoma xenopodis]|uniref:Uncharacterized protein n=1 Tax=Protopolystoma xenopodis TaxID=117903 RepID=A0A3S5CF47_9PLAT|nr:unnamed protein product [Protopolystoma xenopodis]
MHTGPRLDAHQPALVVGLFMLLLGRLPVGDAVNRADAIAQPDKYIRYDSSPWSLVVQFAAASAINYGILIFITLVTAAIAKAMEKKYVRYRRGGPVVDDA